MRSRDATSIELPIVLRDRLARLKVHERQAVHEVIEAAVDVYEDLLLQGRPKAQPLSPTPSSTPP